MGQVENGKLAKTSDNILSLTSVLFSRIHTCIYKKLNEKTVAILNSNQLSECTIVTLINVGLLVLMESPVKWSLIGGIGTGSFPFPSSSFHKSLTGAALPVVFSETGSWLAAGKT